MDEGIRGIYIIWGTVSLAALVLTVALRYFGCRNVKRNKWMIPVLGVGFSTFFIFVPIYTAQYSAEDFCALSRLWLIFTNALHNTLRVFVLDGEFEIVKSSVSGLGEPFEACFLSLAGSLYIIAPVLTFKNIISLVGNAGKKFWFRFHRRRPFYIFSELNEKSITLAESIFNNKKNEKPVIVFSDVFEQNEEDDYETVMRAKDIKAILLKEDITRLDAKRKASRTEFFLIGENESENVEQAVRLTQEYKNECEKREISIYIYSDKPSAGYIIDSVDKGKYTLGKALTERIRRDPEAFLKNGANEDKRDKRGERGKKKKTEESEFRIRRINSAEVLVRRVLTREETIDAVFRDNASKTVSVTILGMGSFGKEFLNQTLWMFQILGYKLEVNVICAPSAESGDIIKKLGHEWPEIITDPSSRSFVRDEVGDANYDIRFFDDTDCFSTDFDSLFAVGSPYRDRLKRTQVAVVSLGDDDKNIDAAVMLRSVFDRVNETSEDSPRTRPIIYSVVYDDKKAANLSSNENGGGIVNYRGDSFRIYFIGNLSDQYFYDRIEDEKELEYSALWYHLEWLRRDEAVKNDGEALADAIIEKAKAYSSYEYYRKSSVARAAHEKILAGAKEYTKMSSLDGPPNCLCEDGDAALVTEHMRWNVYMRTLGYTYSPTRNDRAKLHCDLKPWGDLSDHEKGKDKKPPKINQREETFL